MAVMDADGLLSRSARGAMNRLSEFVHVCAIYLGIAVLVTMVLGATVPSLREQAKQIHEALLIALQPDGLKQDMLASYGAHTGSAGQGRSPTPAFDFRSALVDSMAGRHVAGITSAQNQALRSYIARKYRIAHSVAGALINTAFTEARARGLDPQLVLAVIAIESRYNPYAESHVGAQGLMQVMTRVHKDKFEALNEDPIAALNPLANIKVGVQILYDCIKRRGSVQGGLYCYVGATGPSDGGYGAKVLAERRRIALASGIPVEP
ncbi:lytic transglycosylase domain-containing protein [Pollutimonas thiosulfatoxidans]|uniref:Lytic transglycosylase n=1 Tax=Pollutimonas thiosulfatoxidans TaxID=2028345 RepID=A0A410G8E7_9BURK|nr:transglycosylase SLT domain-containing protein [Pollutimonas thiosulfatoxidans]QAA92563.1 lytic transglycosylase [Pollutimonas thiosulfatoxidans]